MKNESLVQDYVTRCRARIQAIQTLHKHQSWPDVVCESQETCELALKALLRHFKIDPPRTHDVSQVLLENKDLFPKTVQTEIKDLVLISRSLRKDRELSFFGSEDLTPSEFYQKKDADQAIEWTNTVVGIVENAVR